MKINPFLTCLGYFGISTGASNSIQGVYSLNSGDSKIIYNQIYPNSYQYQSQNVVSGNLYAPSFPLINLNTSQIINNTFSGNQCYRLGYENSGTYSVVMDIQYSGCQKTGFRGKDYVLFSTADSSINLGSGFILGINDVNRLYFQTSGYARTVSKELSNHDFIYLSVSQQQYLEFGVFNVADNQLYNEVIDVGSPSLTSKSVYFGGFLQNNDTNYTGFYGQINNIIAFTNTITAADVETCIDCSFATGFFTSTGTITVTGYQITGTYFSGVSGSQSFASIEQMVSIPTNHGSYVQVSYPYQLFNSILTSEIAIPLLSQTGLVFSRNNLIFNYDTGSIMNFSKFDVGFDLGLQSGDIIEVYTHNQFQNNVGLRTDGFNWPDNDGFIQLVGNGLDETNGIDYQVIRNTISGFDPSDVLSFDVTILESVVMFFSGFWNDVVESGLGFDPIPNFDANYGSQYLPAVVNITGVGAVCTGNPNYPNFGYNVLLNGQKLISGYQYAVTPSGNNFIVSISGGEIINAYTELLYNSTGWYLNRIVEVDDSELTFAPQFTGLMTGLYVITGNTKCITGIQGFSEQVWVNGIRQVKDLDYYKITPCTTISGLNDFEEFSYLFYNNYPIFNFQYPPLGASGYHLSFAANGTISGYLDVVTNWSGINVGSYPSGTFLELWASVNNSGSNLIKTLDVISTGYRWTWGPTQSATFSLKTRYRNGNIVGLFSSGISGGY